MANTTSRSDDRDQIVELLHAYAFHFDRNEPSAVGRLFDEHAMIDYGPEMETIHGSAALTETIAVGLREIFAATSHHVSNPMVTFVDDDAAELIAYLYAWHRYHDGSPDGYLWGQYHTKLRRTGGAWRFTELVLKIAGQLDFHRDEMHRIGRAP